MNDAPAPSPEPKKKKFRSPPYPMFDLAKAVERIIALYQQAQHHTVGASVLADAWNMKSGDGKVWRAAAALIQYGLLTDSGTGKTRKFQIADGAKRLVLDTNPDSDRRKEALKAAALAPMIHRELWEKFRTTNGLADSVITTYLTLDREEAGESPYSQSAAAEVLSTYRASIDYAGLSESDTVVPSAEVKEPVNDADDGHYVSSKASVGDWIKWTSGGIDQFTSRKVSWVSDDGTHLRVIGSNTEIPMSEVEIIDAPVKTQVHESESETAEATGGQAAQSRQTSGSGKLKSVSTSIVGGRLQLTADVSADEIKALKDMLSKYEEILKLIN